MDISTIVNSFRIYSQNLLQLKYRRSVKSRSSIRVSRNQGSVQNRISAAFVALVVASVPVLSVPVSARGSCEETRDIAIADAQREEAECRASWWNIFDGSGCGFQYLFTVRDINREYQSCKAGERGAMRDPTGK